MAWQPCLRCGQRFTGEALNVYCSLYLGEEAENYRYVVCPECCDLVMLEWRCRALFRSLGGEWEYAEPTDVPVSRLRPVEEPSERLKRGKRPKSPS